MTSVIQLCQEGMKREHAGDVNGARTLFAQAWEQSADDYDKCVAAHFVSRLQDSPEEVLRWNTLALTHADKVDGERVKSFYPSLYFCMGSSHETLHDLAQAKKYFQLASDNVHILANDDYGTNLRDRINSALAKLEQPNG